MLLVVGQKSSQRKEFLSSREERAQIQNLECVHSLVCEVLFYITNVVFGLEMKKVCVPWNIQCKKCCHESVRYPVLS